MRNAKHGQRWTAEEDEYLRLHSAAPIADVARALSRPLWGVDKRRALLGISNPRSLIVPKRLARELAERFATIAQCTADDVLGRNRAYHIAWARQQVARELRVRGYSLPSIGTALGLDHTSIIHCIERSSRPCPAPAKHFLANRGKAVTLPEPEPEVVIVREPDAIAIPTPSVLPQSSIRQPTKAELMSGRASWSPPPLKL